jgi:hypothetical protein
MTFHPHARRTLTRSLSCVALALTGSLLAGACSGTAPTSEEPSELGSAQQALSERFDGETLLRGVFFGRGPVAALLPEIWGKAPLAQEDAAEAFRSGIKGLESGPDGRPDEELLRLIESGQSPAAQKADEASKLAISRLVEEDPEFLGRFEKGMYSGDPVLVSSTVAEAAKRLSEILEVEIIRDPGRYGSDWFINENIAINVNAALNVNVAVNIDTAYNKVNFWSDPIDRESMLRNELMIATLTQRFAL